MDDFNISLQSQFWIDGSPDNNTDYCSHGNIIFKINDITFLDEDDDTRTVASTALRLMVSALKDYNADTDLEIIPCCGYLLGPGCPTSLTYSTKVSENTITISKIKNSYNRVNGKTITEGPFIIYKVSYIKQVLAFARKVKAFYASSKPRKFAEEYDKNEYEQYWKEFEQCYDRLCSQVSEKR